MQKAKINLLEETSMINWNIIFHTYNVYFYYILHLVYYSCAVLTVQINGCISELLTFKNLCISICSLKSELFLLTNYLKMSYHYY